MSVFLLFVFIVAAPVDIQIVPLEIIIECEFFTFVYHALTKKGDGRQVQVHIRYPYRVNAQIRNTLNKHKIRTRSPKVLLTL